MTEETQRALQDARRAAAVAAERTDAAKVACLAEIAADMPARVDAIAKRIAHTQPDVTRNLGKEKVAEMRTELAAEAESLGARFIAAKDAVEWPMSHGMYSGVESRGVHSALFKHFYKKVDGPARVLQKYGYAVGGDTAGSPGAILPQDLYEERKFKPLADALTAQSRAEEVVRKAAAADNAAAVDDLWG